MINVKYALVVVAAFVAGSFLTPPVQQAIAAVIATDVQCTGCVGNADIASSAVTGSKIGTNAVTTAKLNGGSVTNAKLGDSAVTTSKILDGAIAYADVNKAFIAVGHRDDCNCGGTGWDPDGLHNYAYIYDSNIKSTSTVVVSFGSTFANGRVCNADAFSGHVIVSCTTNIGNGQGVNYAVFNNPVYG